MINRLPIVIAVVAFAGGGTVSAALAGPAQDAPPAQSTQQDNGSWAQNRTAFLDARLAALHAGLELTPDQEKLWPPVEQAMRNFCKFTTSQWQGRRGQEQGLNPVERLEKRSEALIARGQALKKITDAAGPLYATLSDAQKERLPILLRAIYHPFMTEFRHHQKWRQGEGRRNDEGSRQGEDQRHDQDWRQGEDQHQDEDSRDNNAGDHDKMEQQMRGNHMMMHHEDRDDNDGSRDYNND